MMRDMVNICFDTESVLQTDNLHGCNNFVLLAMWRKEDCDEAFKILILMSVESIFTFGEVHWLNRMYMYISYAAHIKKKSYYLPLSMRCFPVTS